MLRNIKKHIANIIVFGVTMLVINALTASLLPKYKADAIIANSNVKLAFIKVPVPFEPLNEGSKVEYRIVCSVKKQALECNL